MNVFEHFRVDALAFGFEVGDLAANHAVDGSCGGGDFGEHGDAAVGVDGCGGNCFEREREKSIAGENGRGFAELLVGSWLAPAQVVVVERGEIVVDERVGVDEFDGAGGIVRGRDVRIEDAGGFEAQNWADAFSTGEDAVTHGLVNGWRLRRLRGHEAVEGGVDFHAVFFKK